MRSEVGCRRMLPVAVFLGMGLLTYVLLYPAGLNSSSATDNSSGQVVHAVIGYASNINSSPGLGAPKPVKADTQPEQKPEKPVQTIAREEPNSDPSSPEEKFRNMMKHRMEERRKLVHDECAHGARNVSVDRIIKRQTFGRLLVDDKRQFIYCMIFKVASSSFRKVLINSTGKVSVEDSKKLHINEGGVLKKYGLRYLSGYGMEDIMFRLQNYYKMVFVRDPFKRLLSAFRDRFGIIDKDRIAWRQGYGRRIIKKYRKNPSKTSLEKAEDVRFDEFLKMVIDEGKTRSLNPHWNTFLGNCQPCIVDYDFIGHLETYEEDAQFALDHIAVKKVHIGDKNYGPSSIKTKADTDTAFDDFYKHIPKSMLDDLRKIYMTDLKLYGYDPMIENSINGYDGQPPTL